MPSYDAPKELKVSYEGICSLKDFVQVVHDYLIERGYKDLAKTEDKFLESYYYEKVTQKGKDVYIWWRAMKEGPHPYISFKLNIDFTIREIKDAEIVYKGQKLKANNCKLEVSLKGKVDFDVDKKLEKSVFGKLLWKRFSNRIYKKEIDAAIVFMENEVKDLQTYIKQYLELKAFMPRIETFAPAKGLI